MNKKCIIALLSLTSVVIIMRWGPLAHYLTLENFQVNAHEIKKFVDYNYLPASIGYMVLYALFASFSLPGALPLSIFGGFLFGIISGTIFINIGATTGAFGAFLLTRHLAGNDFQKKYATRLADFNSHFKQHGPWYLISLRLMPFIPFFLVNIFAGLTKLSSTTFLWTTSLGIIPTSLAYTFIGEQLTTLQPSENFLSPRIIIALIILGLVILLPIIVKSLTDNEDLKA
ncbi:VTT domain-containing protein [Candidatus Babeliales bacterium]|nr:VTT domain-containing protein [Candidatus Babeliales bacterium]